MEKMEVDVEEHFNLKKIEDMYPINSEDDYKKNCDKLAEEIKLKNVHIIQLIESLGVFMVDPVDSKRAFGVQTLTEILLRLPNDFLNSEQLLVISTFFCDKLKDHQQVVISALKGTLVTVQFEYFPGSSVAQILTSLFHNVTCQQQQQSDRYAVYKIFEIFLQKFSNELKAMGIDFVYGVISAIDGERDPRNLLYLFSWIKRFLEVVNLGHLTEEMFEVLACYFPVDFKTPPNDENAITRDKLAEALCPCLCAIPDFAEFCIPLALEKLESSLIIAKLDSLDLLREGCKNFTSDSYLTHSSEIWSHIQKEIVNSSDSKLMNKCLQTLTVVIRKLSKCDDIGFKKILNDIIDTLKGNLLPESKLYETSSLILIATSSACAKSSEHISKHIAPLLENTFTLVNNPNHKAAILDTLIKLSLSFIRYHEQKITEVEELAIIPMLCLRAIESDDNLKIAGFKAFSRIIDHLNEPVLNILLKNIHELIIRDVNENLRQSVLDCFKTLAINNREEVERTVLYKNKISNPRFLKMYLSALCSIFDVEYFRETIVNVILSYMFGDDIISSSVVIEVIKDALNNRTDEKIIEAFIEKDVINRLIDFTIEKEAYDLASDISEILKLLIGARSKEYQQSHINELILKINTCKNREKLYVHLLKGVLIRLHKDLCYNIDFVEFLTNSSVNNNSNVPEVEIVSQILAIFVNKYSDNSIVEEKLEDVKKLCQHSSSKIIVISWITKALLMRNYPKVLIWCNELLDMLEDSRISTGFEIIMNDKCDVLNDENYCNIMPLYRQKFFVIASNKISKNYTPEKSNYTSLIPYLLEYAPKQAIIMQFEKIRKLILLCLETCTDSKPLEILLCTLKKFVDNNERIIEDNLEEFLLRILALTSFNKSMDVRIAAIECISKFRSFPIYKLVPLQQKVLQQLGICVDDKKRLVRKEAMETRSLWFLLEAEK